MDMEILDIQRKEILNIFLQVTDWLESNNFIPFLY